MKCNRNRLHCQLNRNRRLRSRLNLNIFTLHQWCSPETWSRSRDASRDPFFEVSVSKISGLVSVSKDSGLGLETLHRLFVMKFCKEFL